MIELADWRADMGDISNEFIAKQCEKILNEVEEMRTEHDNFPTLLLQVYDHSRRLETRLTDQTKNLELMLKMEMGSQFAHFATRIEQRIVSSLDDLVDRQEHVENFVPGPRT